MFTCHREVATVQRQLHVSVISAISTRVRPRLYDQTFSSHREVAIVIPVVPTYVHRRLLIQTFPSHREMAQDSVQMQVHQSAVLVGMEEDICEAQALYK